MLKLLATASLIAEHPDALLMASQLPHHVGTPSTTQPGEQPQAEACNQDRPWPSSS